MGRTPTATVPATRSYLVHPAWVMVAVAVLALIAAGSFTTLAGLITDPLVQTRGWSRSGIGAGVAVNMVLYGLIAPFSAALMDRYGLRRITALALLVLTISSMLVVAVAPTVFFFVLWWGFAVGTGTGAVTMVFGATVANRWFKERIGLATGVLTAASVVGQFATLPLLSLLLARTDWRYPVLVCGAVAFTALVAVLILLRDQPQQAGVFRYGATGPSDIAGAAAREDNPFARTCAALARSVRDQRFWALAAVFALCGATTNGLMWSHFVPAAHDHGMPATAASTLLAIIGFTNVAGTIAAGWMSDRIDPRALLAVFFLGRAVALAALPALLSANLTSGLVTFAVAFGVLDVATVPPTLTLCRRYFGEDSPLTFGWINVFHEVGAGTMALAGGTIRDIDGTYTTMWLGAAGLAVAAAIVGAAHQSRRAQRSEGTITHTAAR